MKDQQFVIGLDSSTTGTKAVAFDVRGRIAARAHEPIPLHSPRPGYYEQDPEDWWRSARRALKDVAGQIDPRHIRAIAISNQRETFVPLDVSGNALRPAIVWLDDRCKDEVEPFAQKVGTHRIHRITGKPPDYAPVVYRLVWMKNHERESFRKIGMICDVHSYLVWKLTDSFKTSWASADPMGLFDVRSKRWSSPILRALDLQERQFPEVFPPGTSLGRISERASKAIGMSIDTVVVSGGGDGQCAGLGSNALTPKRAYLNLGTAAVAGIYGARYRTSKAFRTMISCSERGYYYECSLRAGTFALDWFIRNLLHIDPSRNPSIYRQLEEEARHVPPGSDGVMYLPYLSGAMNPYWDMHARGAFVGLSSSHGRGHLYRSILEGIAFEQLFALDTVEREAGSKVREVMTIGGGARSRLWCQILSDITGKDVLLPGNMEASALGAAIAGAVGVGWHATFAGGANEMTVIHKTIRPVASRHKQYRRSYREYVKIYPGLKTVRQASQRT